MTPWAALAIFAAGLGAGTVNVIVGKVMSDPDPTITLTVPAPHRRGDGWLSHRAVATRPSP